MRENDETEDALGRYCQRAIESGIEGARVIDPQSIVTAEWVRMKCQFGCPGFGVRLCCPSIAKEQWISDRGSSNP